MQFLPTFRMQLKAINTGENLQGCPIVLSCLLKRHLYILHVSREVTASSQTRCSEVGAIHWLVFSVDRARLDTGELMLSRKKMAASQFTRLMESRWCQQGKSLGCSASVSKKNHTKKVLLGIVFLTKLLLVFFDVVVRAGTIKVWSALSAGYSKNHKRLLDTLWQLVDKWQDRQNKKGSLVELVKSFAY